MPGSDDQVRFKVVSAGGSQPGYSDAVLTVSSAVAGSGRSGWRAVMSMRDNSNGAVERAYGTWRLTIVDAVDVLLQRFVMRIKATDMTRIQNAAADMQTRRAGNLPTRGSGSQPSRGVDIFPTQTPCSGEPVSCVHQIYGLFGDGQQMSSMFQRSSTAWMECAEHMGVPYHLWNAAEVESLVKQQYPQFWDMYARVRYPIMRAVIGRLAVIHHYGGLYADLDIMPNRGWYARTDFALTRVQVRNKRLAAKRRTARKTATTVLEMEVIIGAKGNPVFTDWLAHIQAEIACKDYSRDGSFWHYARMRYVYYTTGPLSMRKFLKMPANAEAVKGLKYLECNHFKECKALTNTQMRHFDVISHASNSYFTTEYEVLVPVGSGDAPLPTDLAVSRREHWPCDQPPVDKRMRVQAPSQDMTEDDREQHKPVCHHNGRYTMVPYFDALEFKRVYVECEKDIDRVSELKAFFCARENCASTNAVLQDMQADLRQWITTE